MYSLLLYKVVSLKRVDLARLQVIYCQTKTPLLAKTYVRNTSKKNCYNLGDIFNPPVGGRRCLWQYDDILPDN
jgi:hypothetical protein